MYEKEHKEKCKDSNWEKILYGKKPLKGILNREDAKKLRLEFENNL